MEEGSELERRVFVNPERSVKVNEDIEKWTESKVGGCALPSAA